MNFSKQKSEKTNLGHNSPLEASPLTKPDPNYRPNPRRAVYIQGTIDQHLVDAVTPRIMSLLSRGGAPITLFIDSRGGSTYMADSIRRLVKAPNLNGSNPCRIIAVATGRAASAAADLLSFGDYTLAYPNATVFYHGVRYTVGDPLTLEKASDYAESMRWRNDLYAMRLAKWSVRRFIFKYAMLSKSFSDYRNRANDQGLTDFQCFLGVLGEKLSRSATHSLKRAQKRFERYDSLVTRVLSRAHKRTKGKPSKRYADFEAIILKEVISAVADRNKDSQWTFSNAGLTQLSDDFMLVLEYITAYDGSDLQDLCNQWGNWFLAPAQQDELKAIADDSQRLQRKYEILKPLVRPVWLFFVALCHSLQEGEENDLSADDACWLGLIDEVIGSAELSPRSFAEWVPDPAPPQDS